MAPSIDLRSKFRMGGFLTIVAAMLALVGAFGTVFLWGLFGPNGLAAAIVYFDVVLFLAAFGSRNLVDSVIMAFRGVNDSSDFTREIKRVTDPSAELEQLRSSLASLQSELTTLKAGLAKRTR